MERKTVEQAMCGQRQLERQSEGESMREQKMGEIETMGEAGNERDRDNWRGNGKDRDNERGKGKDGWKRHRQRQRKRQRQWERETQREADGGAKTTGGRDTQRQRQRLWYRE